MQGISFNLLNANPTNWSNTLKQFVSNLPTNCVGVFDHFVELALKELKQLKVAKKSGSSFFTAAAFIPSLVFSYTIHASFTPPSCLKILSSCQRIWNPIKLGRKTLHRALQLSNSNNCNTNKITNIAR